MEEKDREDQQRRVMDTYFNGVFRQLKVLYKYELNLKEKHLIEIKPSQVSASQLPVGSSALLKLILETENEAKEGMLFKLIAIPHLTEREIKELKEKFEGNKNAYLKMFCSASIDYFGYM